jgi:hypothetical protein
MYAFTVGEPGGNRSTARQIIGQYHARRSRYFKRIGAVAAAWLER